MLEDERRASTSFGMSNKASVRKRKALFEEGRITTMVKNM
jgi:hypothetical protein